MWRKTREYVRTKGYEYEHNLKPGAMDGSKVVEENARIRTPESILRKSKT
jgi:hypothetical protein